MTNEQALTPAEYRALLTAALRESGHADTSRPTAHTLFMPDSHRTALYVDNVVVPGGRGVGKTFWYHTLLDERLRELAATEYRINRLRRLKVHPGHGLDLKSELYPGPPALRALVEAKEDPYYIWYAVLLTALGQAELRDLLEWRDKAAWVRANPGAAQRTLERADEEAHAAKIVHLLLFDALEHLHPERAHADRLVVGILRLALEMRFGTRNIRLKVFIRPDMFESAQAAFADASKLSGYAAALEWTQTDLYGLMFHCLGNEDEDEPDLARRFREVTGGWEDEEAGTRHVPPMLLRNDAFVQEALFGRIADPFMGGNYRKGKPYTWLPNHLMDGKGKTSPRSFLQALATAAEATRSANPAHDRALHHEAIRAGVQDASKRRVKEVGEDTPWVKLAIEPLVGCQVPIEEEDVLKLWRKADLPSMLAADAARYVQADRPEHVRTGPRHPDDLPRLIRELIDLGVMTEPRSDGRLDLPDVYRIAFGLGRRGGVPRPKA
ncbi:MULTISPECIES: hypothetical protein [Streptomyces]|uniref:hypothetical protein n=1 Tax=Streptomyces TaxID=1883 RepID=UPI001291F945|nr:MULTISPECIES: hypothetical protein [Streptomyces]MCX5036859.1 hypothetical protein [Streptomyces coelicoflavus]QFX83062.1 hypothetical protein GEV49_20725 [Streptomyces sp. SYP-A7193]